MRVSLTRTAWHSISYSCGLCAQANVKNSCSPLRNKLFAVGWIVAEERQSCHYQVPGGSGHVPKTGRAC